MNPDGSPSAARKSRKRDLKRKAKTAAGAAVLH